MVRSHRIIGHTPIGDLTIWAAGFFDGEGCISISKPVHRKKGKVWVGYQLQVIIAQKNRKPLDAFVYLFGGRLHPTLYANGSTYWYWRLHGPKAYDFLIQITPYLLLKQAHAEMAMEFYQEFRVTAPKLRRVGTGRTAEQKAVLDKYYELSKTMNTRYAGGTDFTAGEFPPSTKVM